MTSNDALSGLRVLVVAVLTILWGVAMIVSSTLLHVQADSINPGVFAVDSKPYGIPYAEWAGKWQQWLFSVPQPLNPVTDPTGMNCAQGQNGPVWFLAGTTGGSAERTCTIPAGKAIFYPVISAECTYADTPNVKSEPGLVSCAQVDNTRSINLQATVDGVNIKQLNNYRATSPLFNFTISPHNAFGVPAGPTHGIADGFWVFLKPLTPGKHELHFSGLTPGNPTTGTTNFIVDTKYHLTAK